MLPWFKNILSICQHFFKLNALLLLPERCLILFYVTYMILPLSLRCIDFICEVYDFKYLNAVWNDLFWRNKWSENIVVWTCFGEERGLVNSCYTQVMYLSSLLWLPVPISAKSHSVGGVLINQLLKVLI